MSDLTDLYQEVILDHSRSPRHYGPLAGATHSGIGKNPLCGDQLRLHLKLEGDRVADASFEGSGCAISRASASLMTEALIGKNRAEAEEMFDRFHGMVTGKGAPDEDALGKLAVFQGVKAYPARVKCASLAWHTLKAALSDAGKTASTE